MIETFVICLSALTATSGVLFFLDRHLTMTKKWKADMLAYIETRTQRELDIFQKNVMDTLKIVKDEADKAATSAQEMVKKTYSDMEKVNANQLQINEEFKVIKAARGLASGPVTGSRMTPPSHA